jgi:hypothetical protein
VLFLALLGQYVLGGAARGCIGEPQSLHATPMLTGFWLGTCFMLAVTFFVLGCVFAAFDLGAIKTLGAFYLVHAARYVLLVLMNCCCCCFWCRCYFLRDVFFVYTFEGL